MTLTPSLSLTLTLTLSLSETLSLSLSLSLSLTRWGTLNVINNLFKIYFELNNLRLCQASDPSPRPSPHRNP